MSFVQEKLGREDAVRAKHGEPPSPAEIQRVLEAKRQRALANPNDPTSKTILAEQAARVQRVLAEKAAKAGAAPPKGMPPKGAPMGSTQQPQAPKKK